MTDADAPRSLRDHLAAALDASSPDLAGRLDTELDAHLELVALARDAHSETATLLRAAVSSARGVGCTWEQVGAVLGMTRQAAQQRFGSRDDGSADASTAAGGGPVGATTVTLTPLNAFNEMRILTRAGRHGWHTVGYGPLFHTVTRSEQQWEHYRGGFMAGPPPGEGWQRVGSGWGPWTYYTRPVDAPALPGLDDAPEILGW